MLNGMNRDKHETLNNSDIEKMIGISLMFLSMNKRCKYDERFLKEQGLSTFLTIPLTNESIEAPEDLCAALDRTIKDLP